MKKSGAEKRKQIEISIKHIKDSGIREPKQLEKLTREINKIIKEINTSEKHSELRREKFAMQDIQVNLAHEKFEEYKADSDKYSQELEELDKQIMISDIVATCKLVDSSGQLSTYLTSLLKIIRESFSSESNENDIGKIKDELRFKIRNLLDEKIKKIK